MASGESIYQMIPGSKNKKKETTMKAKKETPTAKKDEHFKDTVTLNVTLRLLEPMLGTVPMDPAVYKTFIAGKQEDTVKTEEEVETVPEDIERKGWTTFHKDDEGLFVYDYFVRGFIRNAANVLKDQLGIKNLRGKVTDFVFVRPRRIHLGKKAPDGVVERPLRAMTQQGQRVTLVRSDYVAVGTTLTFQVVILKHKEITRETIEKLLAYGEFQGLGQFRSGGYGRAVVESIAEV